MNNGWISLHRKLLKNPIMRKAEYLSVWIYLLLKANHEEKEFIFNNEKKTCKRGQILTGRKKIADRLAITPTTVENILKYLENQHQIGQQKTNKFRLITINNYNDYQKVDSKVDNKVTTNGQQSDTNNNENNKNNKINICRGELFSFGEEGAIKLSKEEYLKLCRKIGRRKVGVVLADVENWKLKNSKNLKKWTNDYRGILNWIGSDFNANKYNPSWDDFNEEDFESKAEYEKIINKYSR